MDMEKLVRACFLAMPGIGSQRLRQVIAYWGSAVKAREMAPCHGEQGKEGWLAEFCRTCRALDIERMDAMLNKYQIKLTVPADEEYPRLLRDCPGAPPLLFYQGSLRQGEQGVAVVGARQATVYGKSAAAKIAKELAIGGYVVVSGLARGIDGAAHQGALDAKGTTWAFMAGGLDHVYPREHQSLAKKIMASGALISEYPPGTPWEQRRFPARNRLISGVSRGVVVVEAGLRSGSLITADFALEQGRDIFAVPGPIFSEMSKGTHQLLRSGAILAESGEDVLSEFSEEPVKIQKKSEAEQVRQRQGNISAQQSQILACLSDTPLHIDRLTLLCPLSAQEIALGLLELQLGDWIRKLPGHYYVLERK